MSDYDEMIPIFRPPRLNEAAPEFDAPTTFGRRTLTDYRGKWLVLFSHPADFTPVCTSEIMGFARHHSEFQALGCELLGLSVDSAFAHLAWARSIEEKFGVRIPFPIVSDVSMHVAYRYGMIQPGAGDTSTVRTTFVIDPHGVLRAMLYYPMTCGRSVAEILRLVRALQTTDRYGVSTPEGWRPGEKVVVPPPATAGAVEDRMRDDDLDRVDWYFARKELPTTELLLDEMVSA